MFDHCCVAEGTLNSAWSYVDIVAGTGMYTICKESDTAAVFSPALPGSNSTFPLKFRTIPQQLARNQQQAVLAQGKTKDRRIISRSQKTRQH